MTEPRLKEAPARWKRPLLEIFIIVFSILLALFLEDAWQHHEERTLEQQYLMGLALEFANAKAELERDQATRNEILQSVNDLIATGEVPTDPSIDVLVGRITDYRFYTPSHTALEDLLSSGRLHLLQSKPLRRALLGYVQERERLQVAEQREREFVADHVEPEVARHLSYRQLYYRGDEANLLDQITAMEQALQSEVFINILAIRAGRTDTSLRFGGFVEGRIQRVIDLLPSLEPRPAEAHQ